MQEYYKPIGAMLEITSACNLNCLHCYNSNDRRMKKELTDEQWMGVLEKICKNKLAGILFTGGEPFMRENLLKRMLEIISLQPCMEIFINTNGQLLNKDFIKYIKQLPNRVEFQISIDGAFPELHDKVRGVEGAWKKAVESCLMLSSNSVDFRIAHTINAINEEYIENMVQLAIYTGAGLLGMGVAVPLGRGKEDVNHIILNIEKRKEIDKNLMGLKEKYRNYIDIKSTSYGGNDYYKWYLGYYQDWLLVNSEGYVKLENRLPFLVGSILNDSLESVWERVNRLQKSDMVHDKIRECMETGEELDSQQFIFL